MQFFCEKIDKDFVTLDADQAHHLIHVMRAKPGDAISLFDGSGTIAKAQIEKIQKQNVLLKVTEIKNVKPRQTGRIIIASSLAKQDRFEWLISKCTELGVDRISPIIFRHTVKIASGKNIVARYKNLAIAASKQCGRSFLPIIDSPADFGSATDSLKKLYPNAKIIFGSPAAENRSASISAVDDVIVFIGPEAGFDLHEIEMLKKNNAMPMALTQTILRIETAAIAFAALLCIPRDQN